jgi:hypothetical protein
MLANYAMAEDNANAKRLLALLRGYALLFFAFLRMALRCCALLRFAKQSSATPCAV